MSGCMKIIRIAISENRYFSEGIEAAITSDNREKLIKQLSLRMRVAKKVCKQSQLQGLPQEMTRGV